MRPRTARRKALRKAQRAEQATKVVEHNIKFERFLSLARHDDSEYRHALSGCRASADGTHVRHFCGLPGTHFSSTSITTK